MRPATAETFPALPVSNAFWIEFAAAIVRNDLGIFALVMTRAPVEKNQFTQLSPR